MESSLKLIGCIRFYNLPNNMKVTNTILTRYFNRFSCILICDNLLFKEKTYRLVVRPTIDDKVGFFLNCKTKVSKRYEKIYSTLIYETNVHTNEYSKLLNTDYTIPVKEALKNIKLCNCGNIYSKNTELPKNSPCYEHRILENLFEKNYL